MSFLNQFNEAPKLKTLIPVGCLIDIPTGEFLPGKNGEMILNGGLAPLTAIAGRPNTNKSTIAHYMLLTILGRMLDTEGFVYDTEMTLTYQRLTSLARRVIRLAGLDMAEFERILITDGTVTIGNKWFEIFKSIIKERRKNPKKYYLTTPFVDQDGEYVQVFNPLIGEIDSFSQLDMEVVEKMHEKNEVGASGLNTVDLRGSGAKSQLFGRLPGLVGSGGARLILTAHVGDKHVLDPMAPPAKQLAFLNQRDKIKRVPENFMFLTTFCLLCARQTVMQNKDKKTPEFPRNKDDDKPYDTDLLLVTTQILRSKNGGSGSPLEIVISQSEGVLASLTEFYYLKTNGRFGLGGNDLNYYLELLPEVSLRRTTVRGKIDEDIRLQRALRILSQIHQIKTLWRDFDKSLLMEPQELYESIKAQGYDWEIILRYTRDYWIFNEHAKDDPYYHLSTYNLLEMAQGKYHPHWWDDAVKRWEKEKPQPAKTASKKSKTTAEAE